MRGAIVDRNSDKLAFTIEARALTFQPVKVRKQLEEAKQKSAEEGGEDGAPIRRPGCATSPPRWPSG